MNKERNKLSDYIKNVQQALVIARNNTHIYEGIDGALRLAREIGYCLRDLDDKEAKDYLDRSYNEVCVIGYGLKPPVNKKEWDAEVLRKWKGK